MLQKEEKRVQSAFVVCGTRQDPGLFKGGHDSKKTSSQAGFRGASEGLREGRLRAPSRWTGLGKWFMRSTRGTPFWGYEGTVKKGVGSGTQVYVRTKGRLV